MKMLQLLVQLSKEYSGEAHEILYQNSEYTNQGPSKCFMTLNCIRTTIRRARICLQTMQYFEWLRYQRTGNWRITFCGQTKYVLRLCVFNANNSHAWARDKPHTICEHGYLVRLRVSVSIGIVGDTVVGPDLPSDRLNAQRYRNYLETVAPGMLQELLLAVKQILWFQH
jgi:hypothetical protein